MNETLKTIQERYSCRSFNNEMPNNEQLKAIAMAGVEAPSSLNNQPWRVIVVKDSSLIQEMDEEGMHVLAAMEDQTMYNRIKECGGKLFYGAPCMVIVPVDSGNINRSLLDCGIVTQNIALASTSLGLGNVICGLARLVFSGEKAADFKRRLGFPEGYVFGAAVLIGHAVESSTPHEPDESKISFVE